MFVYQRTVRLSETDATGVLYFTQQLQLAVEALEMYWQSKGFNLSEMIEKTPYRLPIVHAEADYSAPMRVGDTVEVQLSLGEIGTTSFTLNARMMKGGIPVGTTKIVHVCISTDTGTAVVIPQSLLNHLLFLTVF